MPRNEKNGNHEIKRDDLRGSWGMKRLAGLSDWTVGRPAGDRGQRIVR